MNPKRTMLSKAIAAVFFVAIAGGTWIAAPEPARAGNPHFVSSCSSVDVSRIDDSLTVNGKEAGLGNEEQVDIRVTATALCINNGNKHPRAANKEALSAEGEFPVQNGKADFSLTLDAVFNPPCSPPMTVEFADISVCDLTNNTCCSVAGTF